MASHLEMDSSLIHSTVVQDTIDSTVVMMGEKRQMGHLCWETLADGIGNPRMSRAPLANPFNATRDNMCSRRVPCIARPNHQARRD